MFMRFFTFVQDAVRCAGLPWRSGLACLLCCILLVNCQKLPNSRIEFPALLVEPPPQSEAAKPKEEAKKEDELKAKFEPTPAAPSQPQVRQPESARRTLKGEAVALNIESLPLAAFINEVYGNILKATFEIAPGLREAKDLVTVRTGEKISPAELDALARQVLSNYGVAVDTQGALLRFVPSKEGTATGEPPLLVSGRALPDVPLTHRPIFQYVPLHVVANSKVVEWLNQAYKGYDLLTIKDTVHNAVLLIGNRIVVAQALDALAVLDQPNMRSRHSVRVEPVYLDAEDMAKSLVEVLHAEGYTATAKMESSENAIVVLPLKKVGAVLVFAPDAKSLAHVKKWVQTLDKPGQGIVDRDQEGIFYYSVQNTRAEEIAQVLVGIVSRMSRTAGTGMSLTGTATVSSTRPGELSVTRSATMSPNSRQLNDPSSVRPNTLTGSGMNTGMSTGTGTGTGTGFGTGTSGKGSSFDGSTATSGTGDSSSSSYTQQSDQLVVDKARNSLVYMGKKSQWDQLLTIIHEMDKQTRMVLIEVTIAEITIGDKEKLGIEWMLQTATNNGQDPMQGTFKTLGGLGIGSQGFSFILDNAGQTRALLNAFATKDRVSILSTPRVMVRSGGKATIDVGTEVPTITGQNVGNTQNEKVYQSVQYRKTGVLLSVKPVIHSGRRVDLEISQEVSQAQAPASGQAIQSPSIFNRKVDTSIGLKDGGSILLGGLISKSKQRGYSGVPILSDIPIVGRVFRVESSEETKTELVMLIVPYIIDNDKDATSVTDALKDQLEGITDQKVPPTVIR